jgi:hypothetical protein
VIEAIALASAIVPAYRYLRARNASLLPLIVLAFAWNPLLHQVLHQEFHEVMLAVPTLVMALVGLQTERRRLLIAGLALTLLVREDMALYVASFGLYFLLCRRRQRLFGAALVVVSAAWFLAVTNWVMPAFGGGSYRHWGQLATSAGSMGDVLRAMAQDPLSWLRRVMGLNTAQAVAYVFLPLAGLALLVPGEQLLWAPALLFLLISPNPFTSSLQGWYTAPLIPLLWACVGRTVARLPRRWAAVGIVALLATTAVGFLLWSPLPGGGRYDSALYTVTEHDRIGQRILSSIPAGVSAAAQSGPGAHLAARQVLYLFPWFDFGAPPEMILLDETTDKPYPLTPSSLHTAIVQIQMDPSVETIWEEDGYFLFQVGFAAAIPSPGSWSWSGQLQLEGYALAQADEGGAFRPAQGTLASGRPVRVALYWTALAAMPHDYSVSVRLVSPDGGIASQDDGWPGRGLFATSGWPVGQTIRDTHYLALPPGLASQTVALQVLIYETDTLRPVSPEAGYTLAEFPLR